MKIKHLTVGECVDRGLNAPSKSHERWFWFELAQAMLDAIPTPTDRDNGLTIPVGGLYHRYSQLANAERFDRTNRYGIAL